MKNLNSKNADFENVSTDNLSFNSINSDTPQSVNDVLAWNGSSWEVKPAADLGVGGGGGGGGAAPSSFASSIPAGVESHAITYGPFSSTPRIASSLEINGDGEIIPYTMSGVSATGYHAVFSDATPNTNYSIHTVFGGESGGESGGLSYNEVIVTVSGGKFYIDGTQQLQLSLQRGLSYRFDQSDSTNTGHPIKFSTLSNGTHNTPGGSEYTAGIVYSGTPGSAGAYTEVTLSQSSPNLYYYCANHSGMGSSALGEITLKANGNVGIGTTNPSAALEVNGVWGSQLRISRDSSPSTQYSEISGGASTMKFLSVSSTPVNPSHSSFTFVSDDGTDEFERMRIDADGKVGIGTTSPSAQLELYNPTGVVGIRIKSVNTETSYVDFADPDDNNPGSIAYNHPTNAMTFKTNDSEKMRISSGGNVGIGTTNPLSSLAVQDSVHGGQIQIGSSSGEDQYQYINFANNWQLGKNVSADNSIGPAGSLYIYNMDLNKTSLCIDTSGNVGIGTTNPSTLLHVTDSSGNGDGVVFIENTLTDFGMGLKVKGGGNHDHQRFALSVQNAAGDDILFAQSQTGNVGIGTTNPTATLDVLGPNATGAFFSAMNAGAGGAEFKRANSNSFPYNHFLFHNGHVGIGTASPDCELSVSGNIRLGPFESSLVSDNKMYYIKSAPYSWGGNSVVTNEIASIGLGCTNTGQDDGTISFSTTFNANLGGTLAERARINSNGALCINSEVDNGYKLYVNGSVFGTAGTLSSDDRVKHNEQNIVGAIETLGKITPKKYIKTIEMYDANHDFELDENGNPVDENGESVEHRIEAGVIAQQVLAVDELAFAVSAEGVDEDGVVTSPYGLDYNSLFTYAIAAIQEQQKLIEDLRSEVEVLKNK